jgi:hypothetical protein
LTTTTEQSAGQLADQAAPESHDDPMARAEAQARENIADFAAMAEAIVGLAELVTQKAGTLALDQLVRGRYLTQECAVRVWRRSGRQDTPPQPLPGIREYREQFGYRRPGELDNSGPRPVSRSVTFDSDDRRKRATAQAEERRYNREIAERVQLRPGAADFRERHPELNMTRPPGSDLYAEERARP